MSDEPRRDCIGGRYPAWQARKDHMKLWLVHPPPFYEGVVPHLEARGIQPTYVVTAQSVWVTMRGRLLDDAPDPALVEVLSPFESEALQMMERINYHRLSIADLRRLYLRYVAMWEVLLRIDMPDVVLFHGVPHMGYDYVLYRMAPRTLIVERTYLPDRMMLMEEF